MLGTDQYIPIERLTPDDVVEVYDQASGLIRPDKVLLKITHSKDYVSEALNITYLLSEISESQHIVLTPAHYLYFMRQS